MLSPHFNQKLATIIVYWTDDMTLKSRWNCYESNFLEQLIVFNPSLVSQIIIPPSMTTVTNVSNCNGHNIHQIYARHCVKCLAASTQLIKIALGDLLLLISQFLRQESVEQILKDQDKHVELLSCGVMIWNQAPYCCVSVMACPPHTNW